MNEETLIQEWINTVDEFLIAIDENGIILTVNQAWIDFCIEQDVRPSLWKPGSDYLGELNSKGKDNELAAVRQVISQEMKEHTQMYAFLKADGSTQWMRIKVRGIKLPFGETRGALIYHEPVDVNAIQPISAETIMESMTDGFSILDDSLQVIYMNEIAEELLEYKRRYAVGQRLLELFPEVIDTSFHHYYKRVLEEQTVMEFVDYYRPLDKWFQVKATPLKKGGLAIYFQDVSEKKRTEEKLNESTYYDYLTGLPNRKFILQKARSLQEEKRYFTIYHVTIDNLAFINAAHHYKAGDTIMVHAAEELKRFDSADCHVGRLESHDFAILREETGDDNPEDILAAVKEIFCPPIELDNGQKVNISVSIGVAFSLNDTVSVEEVFSYAEMAMSEAKDFRGSSHSFFQPEMKTSRDRQQAIENGLESDLKANGFYFTLQPIIHGATGEVASAEVLSRWEHPELGTISPSEFIGAAEKTGAIARLTCHLLEEVFTQLKDWEKRFGWNKRTAINMTPSLLSNPIFFNDLFGLMDRFEIHPSLIEIEITEQAELTYSRTTMENLLMCQTKGISIAIDDFGTGFSMISYLSHFPINKIKIDKSFVQKIGGDRKSEAVLKSLIHLAKSMECELVAEGVERNEEAAFLKENGCWLHQGYLYDHPLKTDEFEAKYLHR